MSLKIKNLIAEIEKKFRDEGYRIFQIDKNLSIMQMGSRRYKYNNEIINLILTIFDSQKFNMEIKYLEGCSGSIIIKEEEVITIIEASISKKKRFRRCRIIIKIIQLDKLLDKRWAN